MTKKQLKEKYDAWNIAISKYESQKNDIFLELQNLCEEACGERSCCFQDCLQKVMNTDKAWRAMHLYEKYYEIEGANQALMHFAMDTDNFKI